MQNLLYDAFILAVVPLENLQVRLVDVKKAVARQYSCFAFSSEGFALRYLKQHTNQRIMQIEK